jgi:hypothetical protein
MTCAAGEVLAATGGAGDIAGAGDTAGAPLKYCRKMVTAAMIDKTISRMTLLRSAPSFIGEPLIG